MSLNNVDSSNGYLEATDTDGYAISKAIVQDNGKNISVSDESYNSIVPAMTDYSQDGFVVSASNEFGTPDYTAWKAFDEVEGTIYGWYTDSSSAWLKIEFPDIYFIDKYSVQARNDATDILNPTDWTLEGSNDDSTWNVIDTQSAQTFTTNEIKEYVLSLAVQYKYIRINVTNTAVAGNCLIQELKLLNLKYRDLLVSEDKIIDGDDLVIELDDGSYNDFVANGVIGGFIDNYDPFNDSSGIALYKFDNSANDESGNYNGTEVSTEYVDGKYKNGIQGNKSIHSYIESSLALGPTSSISFWVKESDLAGDQIFLSNNSDAFIVASYTDYWMKVSSSGVIFSDGNTMIPTLDDWYHIVLTDDGSNIRGYRNGIEITNTVSYLSMNGFILNFIGAYTSAGPSHSGILDQLRVFNRALTPSEVNDLYIKEHYLLDTSSVTNGEIPDKVYLKDTFLPDFTGVESIIGKFEYKNISEADAVDELKTPEKIKDGDNLVIVKDDDSIHEIVANGIAYGETVDIFGDNSSTLLYRFEDNCNDSGGNYDAVVNGTDSYDIGIIGKSLLFPTSSFYLDTGSQLLGTEYTVSCWINPSRSGEASRVLYSQYTSGDTNRHSVYLMDTGTIKILSGGSYYETPIIQNENEWTHLIISKNSSGYTVYANGNNVYSFSSTAGISSATTKIGEYLPESIQQFKGYMDQFRILNKKITDSEAITLYNEIYTMDTSSITQGEVPTKVYRNDESVFFNDIEATADSNSSQYDFTKKYISESSDPLNDNSGIAYWKLKGDYTDVGGQYDGTAIANGRFLSDTTFGQCFYSSQDGACQFPLPQLNSNISISFWIYDINPSSDSGKLWIVHFSQDDSNSFCFLNDQTIVSGTDVYYMHAQNGSGTLPTDLGPLYSVWHHFILTTDGKIYRDGNLYTTTTYTADASTFNRNLVLGADRDAGENFNEYMNGYLAEVRLFNKSISDEEAQLIYDNEKIQFLSGDKSFNTTDTPGRSITTKIQMSATGNKMTQLDFDIMRQTNPVEDWVDENNNIWVDENNERWTTEQ